MDFSLTEERQMLADMIGRFVQNEYKLTDRNTAAHSEVGYSPEVWGKLAELGVPAALFREEVGGFGGTGFDLAAVFEALGRGLVVEPLIDSVLVPGAILARAGNADQRALLGQLVSGETRLAFAPYEDGSHFETTFVTMTAEKSANGWMMNGAKAAVKFAEGSSHIVVSARTSGDENDAEGISLFLVPTSTDGLTLTGYGTVDGGRAAELAADNVALQADALIGPEGAGHDILEQAIGQGLVALSAEALGIMEKIKELTLEYLRTRQQFGLPIGRFQALQHRMAQVLLEIEQARSAVINAANGLEKTGPEREKTLSATKYTIGRIGALVVEESIQMHGGIGMTWEYDLGHYAKRLTMIDHEFGDEDYHLARFIALG